MRDYTREALIRRNGAIALGINCEENYLGFMIGSQEEEYEGI